VLIKKCFFLPKNSIVACNSEGMSKILSVVSMMNNIMWSHLWSVLVKTYHWRCWVSVLVMLMMRELSQVVRVGGWMTEKRGDPDVGSELYNFKYLWVK
jgi:hypothetical protein